MSFATSMSLFSHHKICFIDEADYLSKSSQASLRGVIEDTSKNCRYIFTANDMSKIHPALCSRLMPICFDMTPLQIEEELKRYKTRVTEFINQNSLNIDMNRISRIIDMNFPDYRIIANKLEFEIV
jgi:DNA polymerase III delta prime subunit